MTAGKKLAHYKPLKKPLQVPILCVLEVCHTLNTRSWRCKDLNRKKLRFKTCILQNILIQLLDQLVILHYQNSYKSFISNYDEGTCISSKRRNKWFHLFIYHVWGGIFKQILSLEFLSPLKKREPKYYPSRISKTYPQPHHLHFASATQLIPYLHLVKHRSL